MNDRARRAYLALLGADDPAEAALAGGAVDLRPVWDGTDIRSLIAPGGAAVISGPGDLLEIRRLVERMTGPDTWPTRALPSGIESVVSKRTEIDLPRPAPALALVMAMDGLIDDRSSAWRTWKTVVDSVAKGLAEVDRITIEVLLIVASD